MNSNQERSSQRPEKEASKELEQAGIEQREKIREQLERSGEKTHETVDDARHEALERATSREVEKETEQIRQESLAERRTTGPIGKTERDVSFQTTMTEVRSQMSAPSRAFSKVIHNKTVEKVSEATGSTIARPNALLSGAVCAFVLTLAVYLIAKNLGYPLSGFESIGAFILGWSIGITYDFLKVMTTGRK